MAFDRAISLLHFALCRLKQATAYSLVLVTIIHTFQPVRKILQIGMHRTIIPFSFLLFFTPSKTPSLAHQARNNLFVERITTMQCEESIGSRVSQRKRGFGSFLNHEQRQEQDTSSSSPPPSARPKSRRRLEVPQEYTSDDVFVIKETFGHYQHHGTGNPLAKRAPSSPPDFAVTNLAAIIQHGQVGKELSTRSTDSTTPQLTTERGKSNDGAFWMNRLRLAGSYGWTGLVLESDASSSNPLPIAEIKWFLVESEEERTLLQEKLTQEKWNQVQERVVTVSRLAEIARKGGD